MKSMFSQSHTILTGGAFAALLFSGCVSYTLLSPVVAYSYEVVARNDYQPSGEKAQRTMLRNRPSSVAVKRVVAFEEDESILLPVQPSVKVVTSTRFPSVKRTEVTVKPLAYYNRPVPNIEKVRSKVKIVHVPPKIRNLPVENVPFSYPVVAPQKTVVVFSEPPVNIPTIQPSSPVVAPAPVSASFVVLPWLQEESKSSVVTMTQPQVTENMVAPLYQPVAAVMPQKKTEESPAAIIQESYLSSQPVDVMVQPVETSAQPSVLVPKVIPQSLPLDEKKNDESSDVNSQIVANTPSTQQAPDEVVVTIPAMEETTVIAEVPIEAKKESVIEQVTPQEVAPISLETEGILHRLPQDIFPEPRKANPFDVKRSKQDVEIPAEVGGMEIGASVSVRRQTIDVNYELEKAYNALLRGNTDIAVAIYQDILTVEPNNTHALFGLATTYHKLGLLDKARPLYGQLLEIDPYNKETLNNFLALVGEEAPESAIRYLEQLKGKNSDFSPIYAQLAQLYLKQENKQLAIENMQEAVAMSPDNLIYKYNLAVLYDNIKEVDRAMVLYRQLIKSGLDGEELPANLRDIQERLTFLSSNSR